MQIRTIFLLLHTFLTHPSKPATHILKPSLQLPLTFLSNNPSTSDCPTKQFKHSLFSGAQPEFRWEKTLANRRLHTFLQDFFAEAERAALLRGLIQLHLQKRHLARKPCSVVFCPFFFFPETPVFLLSVIHLFSCKCKWCTFSLYCNFYSEPSNFSLHD